MNASVRRQASAEASACSSYVRSKKECALVGDDLVLDAGGGQRLVEGDVLVRGDALVVPGLKGEDRCLHLRGACDRAKPDVAVEQLPWKPTAPASP